MAKKQTPVPEGYELLNRSAIIKHGDLFLDVVDNPTGSWQQTNCGGSKQTCQDLIYCRKIQTVANPKVRATRSKDTKAVWTHKSVSVPAKATKADLVKLLQETVDQLNETGTKLVAAQNTITRLKKKAAK